ncbi:MAG: capsular polysaccharide biosynthesis protein [Desulfovibrionaceae bacterium]|nr:capsular polysaccharide biosynthesis protein [Desulfovibrionaceae bacterium]
MGRLTRYYLRHAVAKLRSTVSFKPPEWLKASFMGLDTPCYVSFSKKLSKIPYLPGFLGHPVMYVPRFAKALLAKIYPKVLGVLVWGVKEETQVTLTKDTFTSLGLLHTYIIKRGAQSASRMGCAIACKFNLPLIRLEDGFLRSLDLGVLGAPPLSIVVDTTGMYYDARHPSDLENILNSAEDFTEQAARCSKYCADLKKYNLSKYNQAKDFDAQSLPHDNISRILIIDQTLGDVSITLGGASSHTFQEMLTHVLAKHAHDHIYLKIHPDVISGRKQGHFDLKKLPKEITIIAEDVAPLSLLEQMDEVYTVSSQMGFEALLLGKKVHCFGLPFYAGWGVTEDQLTCPRRNRKRNVLDIFYAAYILYARYIQPTTGTACAIDQVINLLHVQRSINNANRGYHACFGFKRWKQAHIKAFLASSSGESHCFKTINEACAQAKAHNGQVVVWSTQVKPKVLQAVQAFQVPLVRVEDGFLRSVGLGSNFFRPGSLVIDDLGIYFDPSAPSRLESILNAERTDEELAQARTLIKLLVDLGISKYNVRGKRELPNLPTDRTVILVPGQVEDDASVRLGGQGIYSNLGLLKTVRAAHPNSYLIYKEHPDVVSGNRIGKVQESDLKQIADLVLRTTPIEDVLQVVDEVHTLTSLTGFEALLRGRKVYTYGGPFYAGFGLTIDRLKFPRRKPLASLEHLVAGTLLIYPRYYDWVNGQITDCFSFLEWLVKAKTNAYTAKDIL